MNNFLVSFQRSADRLGYSNGAQGQPTKTLKVERKNHEGSR